MSSIIEDQLKRNIDSFSELNRLDKNRYKKLLIIFITLALFLSLAPTIFFSLVQQILVGTSGADNEFSTSRPVSGGQTVVLMAVYIPCNLIWLYLIFKPMLHSLAYESSEKLIYSFDRARRRFQILYFPVTIMFTLVFILVALPPSNLAELIDASSAGIAYPSVFNVPAFLLLEYLLDRIATPLINSNLKTVNDLNLFKSLTSSQKYALIGISIAVGSFCYTTSVIIPRGATFETLNYSQMFLFFIFFVVPLISYVIYNNLKNPQLNTISSSMANFLVMSDENIENNLPIVSVDELGNLVQLHNAIVQKQSKLIRVVKDKSVILDESAIKVASTAEEVLSLTEEIASTIQSISNGATNQSNFSSHALVDVQSLNKSINTSINDITSLVDSISGIAKQTNILALNAAIEAARAGEYGRGFAVVSDNVRRLSEETRQSSERINSITDDIYSGLRQDVLKLTDSFQNFAVQSEEFSASSEEVAAATEEQSSAMNELNRVAQELSALSSELAKIVGIDKN